MQYVNPMALNCWAIKDLAPEIRTVVLCHSVQHTAAHLAQCLGEWIGSRGECLIERHIADAMAAPHWHD
ncbi:hypothetical protein ACC743_39890, partial [Rhizobium ruizarguesonis]